MLRRDRIVKALNFEETDRVPMDLGGMRSSSISCFRYSELRDFLGLSKGLPLIYDEFQMLAIPEPDVLDALDCDVVFYNGRYSNAFDETANFSYYDFNGRLPAMVEDPDSYSVLENGTIVKDGKSMPVGSTVFDAPHGGHAFDIDNVYKIPLEDLRMELEAKMLSDREIDELAEGCRRVREATDRAVFLNGFNVNLGFIGGIANGSMLCLLEPDYVKSYNGMKGEYVAAQMEKIIKAVGGNIDVVLTGNHDMGTQNTTIIAPDLIDELVMPYFRMVNDAAHGARSDVKTFLHSCGAIYDVIDSVIDAGFDILNPVQWTAGGHSFKEWKDKSRNRITLWGGGVDSQHLLPLGTLDEIKAQVKEVVSYMKKDGGFVFCNIHNLTAEVGPDKIKAIYDTAKAI
ncbi:MAG: uroporphyrinogen decarboxylase family protein [Clostridia bacterium]|nr:uroporphyrinogen decarboxylase family protein [Clostridia bacterium]